MEFDIIIDGKTHSIKIHEMFNKEKRGNSNLQLGIELDGESFDVIVDCDREVYGDGCTSGDNVRENPEDEERTYNVRMVNDSLELEDLKAPMPGTVLSIEVEEGDEVGRGQLLLVLDAMKMENELRASNNGQVKRINCRVGENVEHGKTLMEFSR